MKERFRYKDYQVEVTARANCRRMVLHSRPGESSFTLSVPYRTTWKDIESFLRANEGWLAEHQQQKMQAWQPKYEAGERHMVLGQRVVLGEQDIPCGADFLEYRYNELVKVVQRLVPIWQERMGVSAAVIRFRDMKSQWGSCNTKTRCVTLNSRLCMCYEDCIECVLVHELCHLRQPDHSPLFHEMMTYYLPSWKEREKRLNAFDGRPLPPQGK